MKTKNVITFILFAFLWNNCFSQSSVQNSLTGTNVYLLAMKDTILFAGTWKNGIYLSSDYGYTWKAINNGLSDLQVRSIAISGNNIFIGTYQGGIFLSSNNGANWKAINSGLGFKTDYNTYTVKAIAIAGTRIYAGLGGGGVYLSVNNGASWKAINTGLEYKDVQVLKVSGNNIYAGTQGGVYLSTTTNPVWKAIKNGLTVTEIHSLAINGTKIYAGTTEYGGGVFKSINNGANWKLISSGITSNIMVWSLAVKGNYIFAGTNHGMYVSTNDGLSWFLANGIPPKDIQTIIISDSSIFAGTLNGVYLSNDNGANWSTITKIKEIKKNTFKPINLPPYTAFDIEPDFGCIKITKVIGGQVAIIEGNITKLGINGPYSLNMGWNSICCPLILDCNTKYVVKNMGTTSAIVEIEEIEK